MATERLITEQSPKHERLKAVQSWTVPSPKIDSLVIEGRLIEFSNILQSRLKLRPDLEVGATASALPGSNENNEDIQPLSKDYTVPAAPSSIPKRTIKQVSDITYRITTASLIKTNSQLNYGAEIELYPKHLRRFYPEGIEQTGSPFTLPTHTEIVKELISDHIRTKAPQEIDESMKLKDDLGMTGTTLTTFEDELERFGFERPGLDLAVQSTVGNVITRLSQQREVVESLSSIVDFPRTKKYYDAQKQFQAMRKSSEEQEGVPTTHSYARYYFENLTGSEPQGAIRFEQVLGVPVFNCEQDEDFQALRPIEQRPIRDETYVYSFVITRSNRLYPQGETQDIPLIVARGNDLDKEVLQHARSQLAFARKSSPQKFSPVLLSELPSNFGDDVKMKVRNYLLSVLVSQTEPVDWYRDEVEGEGASVKRGQLLPQQRELFSGSREDSPLYMRPWLGQFERLFSRKAKKEIYDEMIKQMKIDVGVISRMVQINPNVGWQVFVGDFLGNFDDWEAAERLFEHWELRNKFRDTFGEIPPPSTDIFRQRAPDSKLLEETQ